MKYILTLLLALTLTACGFTPMHAGKSGASLQNIEVQLQGGEDLGDEQAGFFVVQRIKDRIGEAATPQYTLRLEPSARRRGIGITDRDVAARFDTILSMEYQLIDTKTGDVLDKGDVSSSTTFGAPNDPYGVVAADNNSKQQAASEVADRLLNTLAAYFAANKTAP